FSLSATSPHRANYCRTRTCGFQTFEPDRRFSSIVPEIVPVAMSRRRAALAEVADAHDIVSLEHAPGLVSRHLHRDPLRDAGADEIADGGSTEVVQTPTGASRLLARGPECNPEALDRPARAVEHTRADDLELPLEILGDRSLLFKHLTQLARHRERASLAVLGLSWIEPHCARAEIDLAPLERQDLAVDPPAGDGLLVTPGSN